MENANQIDFEKYKLVHTFYHETPLKGWINADTYTNMFTDFNSLTEVLKKIYNLGFVEQEAEELKKCTAALCNLDSVQLFESIVEFIQFYNYTVEKVRFRTPANWTAKDRMYFKRKGFEVVKDKNIEDKYFIIDRSDSEGNLFLEGSKAWIIDHLKRQLTLDEIEREMEDLREV